MLSIACVVCVLVKLLGVPISFRILVPRATVIEIRVIHRPYVFRYLLQSKINILLIAVQVIFKPINLQIDFVDSTFHHLLFFLSLHLLLLFRLVPLRIWYIPNGILIRFLNLQLIAVSHLCQGIRRLNLRRYHSSLLPLRELPLVVGLRDTKAISRSVRRVWV